MNLIKSSLAVLLLIAFIWALNTRLAGTPPLGKLLNPTTGLWKNAESGIATGNASFSVKGIKNGVSVKYDKSYVPHVFADNDYDLYFAQGYVTAKDRLYQMDRQEPWRK
jgi:penicillin amidase